MSKYTSHICPICDARVGDIDALRRHVKTEHNKARPRRKPPSPAPETRDDTRAGGDQAQEGGWLPIETAPRDGSEFLAGCDRVADGFQQVVFWDDDAAVHGWGVKDSDAIAPFSFFTHWRPLPPPPSLAPETRDDTRDGEV